jgi:hypothetical protein
VIDGGSCFAGSLMELALAADRSYMLSAGRARGSRSRSSTTGRCRCRTGCRAWPRASSASRSAPRRRSSARSTRDEALDAGLVTFAPDDIDWEDEVRLAIEERASLSPDALTGMESNLRFAGPETLETKIFGRLSAWQNWIFQRPNAVGEKGALTLLRKARAREVRLVAHLTTSRGHHVNRRPEREDPNNVDLSQDKRLHARPGAVAPQLPVVVEGHGPCGVPGEGRLAADRDQPWTPRAGPTSTT